MKFNYQFSNLCGTVYKRGNVVFSNDGDKVISPVGNRLTVFDLKNNKSRTLPFENQKNISSVVLSPDDSTIITTDEDGHSLLCSLRTNAVLHHFNFKKPVVDIKYSPNGRFVAASHGKHVQVWHAPGHTRDFAPFTLHRTYTGQYDDIVCLNWSDDSRFLIAGSKDMTARIFSLYPMEGFTPVTLSGHRNTVIGCFFEMNSMNAYTVSQDGALFVWTCNQQCDEIQLRKKPDENDNTQKLTETNDAEKTVQINWTRQEKHFFNQDHSDATCAAFHKPTHLLVVGFSTGIFTLYEIPDFNLIHTLSISQHKVNTVAVNPTGEWLVFGSSSLGQLLVWEWQSESYVLKQQGHYYDMNVLAYSPDGQLVATGGEDGKLKLWNTTSGFCFVTFNEHNSGVTGVVFNHTGHVVVSASLDGTVRAFDLNRYRNFRTFTSPRPAQFSCLALDSSGELVCAGALDTFEIFVWSMQTGRLLEVLAGHVGPISSLSFSPSAASLASGSWDKTVKVWDVFVTKAPKDNFNLTSDVLAVTYRPDGLELAVATLDGHITFWDPMKSIQTGSVEGRNDLGGGRRALDKISAKSSAFGKSFTSLCYTADGQCVLAGGRSKFVCIYHVQQQILLKRFEISRNLSFDAMQEFLNSKNMTAAGGIDEIDNKDDEDDISLPGVTKGDLSSRKTKPEIRVKCVQFSPTGRAWSAVSTEGLMIYSLDNALVFDPFDLDIDVTPTTIRSVLEKGEFTRALVLSFRLNEQNLILEVVESISPEDITLVVQSLSETYADKMLNFVAGQLESSKHLEFYLLWCQQLLAFHGHGMKSRVASVMSTLRTLQKNITRQQEDLGKICDSNKYCMEYIVNLSQFPRITSEEMDETTDLIEE